MEQHQRREFLKRIGVGAAGALTAGYSSSSSGFAANETLHIGCIGTGGRCRQLMSALQKIAGVRIVAVCDVWDDNLERGRKLAESEAFTTKDFRKLLARRDVDAIIIGAPDH